MKKTKVAVLFTALIATCGLSSCLGDPDPYTINTEIMKVNTYYGSYSFESAGGYTVSPSNPEILSGILDLNGFAYVAYKFDTRAITQGKPIEAEIQGVGPIEDIALDYTGMESNASVLSIMSPLESSQYIPPYPAMFYDKTNMFIDLTYYYVGAAEQDKLNEELKKHRFYLYCPTNQEDEGIDNKTMVLNLIHVVDDVDNNENRKTLRRETLHVDLSYFVGLNGNEPEKIIIKFKQSPNSSVENAEEKEIEIPYKSIVEEYNKNSSSM